MQTIAMAYRAAKPSVLNKGSFNGEKTVQNRWLPECRTNERPVHGLDTADPCEQRPQGGIVQPGHRLRVRDRCAALQRCRVAQDIGLARQLRWRIHCRVLFPALRCTRATAK